MQTFNLAPGSLTQGELRTIGAQAAEISLPDAAWEQVRNSHQHLQMVVQRGAPAYGINTGFGKLAKTHAYRDRSTTRNVSGP